MLIVGSHLVTPVAAAAFQRQDGAGQEPSLESLAVLTIILFLLNLLGCERRSIHLLSLEVLSLTKVHGLGDELHGGL
jgi:hypothetical protein